MSDALIKEEYVVKGAQWIKMNFGSTISTVLDGSPFDINLACAIACQESLYYWYNLRKKYDSQYILEHCVLDASGDDPASPRDVFPLNTQEFIDKYGSQQAQFFIDEANINRQLRNLPPAAMVYKGYGIFQYDLQYITVNPDFFFKRQWCSIEKCTEMLLAELTEKAKTHQQLYDIVRAYNGTGQDAKDYADKVMRYYQYCSGE